MMRICKLQLIFNCFAFIRTFTDRCVGQCVTCLTDTLERTNCVVAQEVFVTWVVLALVDVVETVSALEAVRTFGASGGRIARSVVVTTIAVTKTILSPLPASADCMKGGYVDVLVFADLRS